MFHLCGIAMEICRFLPLVCLIDICDSSQGLTDTWSQQPNKTAVAYVVAVLLVCLQSLLADRLQHLFSKKHRPPRRCRRIKGRRYRHGRGRKGKQSRQPTGRYQWARSRKLRNRQAHTVNGNGPITNVAQVQPAPSKETMTADQTHVGAEVPRSRLDKRATALGKVAVPTPGDGWCLFHAVSWYFHQHEGQELAWCVKRAAETYLQALEWLTNQLDTGKAEEVLVACMPEEPQELDDHKRFLHQRHLTLWPDMPPGQIVLWSKLVRVLEVPRMLDTMHQGGYVELCALTEAFDFEVLVWTTERNDNRWIGGGTQDLRVSDVEATRRANEHPKLLQLIYDGSGYSGHYALLRSERPATPVFKKTPFG